jgi:2,4-dienoyl-CoA reductase-like NADH-dependent reductase (Old Yellow Enzyme family)
MSYLFSPLTIKGLTFKNRIVVSPMCQYSAVDGFPNDWHLVHLGSRAVGGAALILAEATGVSPEARITPFDLGLWNDDQMDAFRRITDFIRQQGSIPGIQLAHAGRKASTDAPWRGGGLLGHSEGGWQQVAPSAVGFRPEEVPEALTDAGIHKVIRDFSDAADRAFRCGFRVLEIHAAHGYLIHQFLSPLSNARTDKYGGPFENRTRILTDIIHAVKQVWPQELPLFVRISATDWVEGGWDLAQSVKLAEILKGLGVDVIDCSSGGLVPHAKIPAGPNYQVPFAFRIKAETGMMTGAVGLITEARQAEAILADNQADLIIVARQLLRNPYFPLQAAVELNEDVEWPVQYERAKPRPQ